MIAKQLKLFSLPGPPFLSRFTRQERLVFQLLASGRKLTGIEIARALNISDPNAVIRNLRAKGVNIGDYPHPLNRRRKVFFFR